MNDQGIHFPIWGVCLGLQIMHAIEAPKIGVFNFFNTVYWQSPLFWSEDAFESKLLRDFPADIIEIVEQEKVTI